MHSFKELVTQFEERFTNSLPFALSPATLYDPCRYLLQLGGKRVRPVL
jgi:geranylgeranyl diphosphate synthase type II